MRGPAASLRRLLGGFADFLFPPVCLGCDADIERGLVCAPCRERLFGGGPGVCPRCGRPVRRGAGDCGRCGVTTSVERVRALGPYAPPFIGLVQALKYQNKTALTSLLGAALCGLVESDPELARCDVVCPVPLHRARRRERGYNQAELLAREVAAGTGIRCADLLVRRRNTRTQTHLADDRARQVNVSRAFAPAAGLRLESERVLLVDDVTTSGATLDAAGRQLLAAGAGSVAGLVIAAA
ncbi:MAG: ComF family protein [bacterium]